MTCRATGKNKLQKLIKAYERFVPHEFLNFLGKKNITNISLGDQIEENMTILFTDIRDFTSLSEELTPRQNFSFINSYLGCMEPVISEHHGIIDKYIGDAVMALFSTGADEALTCSNAMLSALNEFNKTRRKAGKKSINIGIGLNTELMTSIFKKKKTDKINKAISFLDEYIVTHFRYEEELMKAYEYPFIDLQKWQHKKFTQQFIRFKQEIHSLDNTNRNFILFRLQVLLVDWLVNHTLKTDKHLGRFIKRKTALPH